MIISSSLAHIAVSDVDIATEPLFSHRVRKHLMVASQGSVFLLFHGGDLEANRYKEEQAAELTQAKDNSNIRFTLSVGVRHFDYSSHVPLNRLVSISRVDNIHEGRSIHLKHLFNTG